jgi:hypothetical protein
MFKKTITELKELNETPKEIVISTTVDSDKVAKNVIKTWAAVVGISITARVAILLIDSKNPKYQMPSSD